MTDHVEIEQKFDVDPDFRRPDFAGLRARLRDAGADDAEVAAVTAAAPVRHQLRATYFDTADGRLAAAKITLRRRTGGADEGWHLKLPRDRSAAGVSSRLEVHAPLAEGSTEVPGRLAARVAEITGGRPLAPIATLDTERTVVTVTGRDGRLLAEIADDVVTARRLTGTSGPLRWREVEVEVPSPAPALQRAAADLLFAAGARPAAHGSKLGRLLGR
jgi:inorganic triphosphatase YgiF